MQEPTRPSLFVSVAVRSYRRLPQLFELIAALQRQSHPDFEIVVIEQSPLDRERYRSQFERVSQDPRVRVLEYPALGAGAARNEAARQARGEIVLFIDDDDLPLGDDWISLHVENYADPACVAVSGRHVQHPLEPASDSPRCRRLCLRYSWLKMPRGRTNYGGRIVGVTQVAGTNASIRRSAIERAGGWDNAEDHDEDSFNFRFARIKERHEYFVFDPQPVILRRLDVPGGLDRRQQTLAQRLLTELRYSHGVIRRYFPLRFWLLYQVYLACAAQRAVTHVLASRRYKRGASLSATVTDS
jgi:glycosyltransferase involved in cell wall biosynthesis